MRRHKAKEFSKARVLLAALVLLSLSASAGRALDEGPEGERAIQIVKAYTPQGALYSVISNIEKRAADDKRAGNEWKRSTWEAFLPTRKDVLMARLSEYFTFVRPTGNYEVRFTYEDKDGTHTALWATNVYTRKVETLNDEARGFVGKPGSPQAAPPAL
jgi:hypothetical protein